MVVGFFENGVILNDCQIQPASCIMPWGQQEPNPFGKRQKDESWWKCTRFKDMSFCLYESTVTFVFHCWFSCLLVIIWLSVVFLKVGELPSTRKASITMQFNRLFKLELHVKLHVKLHCHGPSWTRMCSQAFTSSISKAQL